MITLMFISFSTVTKYMKFSRSKEFFNIKSYLYASSTPSLLLQTSSTMNKSTNLLFKSIAKLVVLHCFRYFFHYFGSQQILLPPFDGFFSCFPPLLFLFCFIQFLVLVCIDVCIVFVVCYRSSFQ